MMPSLIPHVGEMRLLIAVVTPSVKVKEGAGGAGSKLGVESPWTSAIVPLLGSSIGSSDPGTIFASN